MTSFFFILKRVMRGVQQILLTEKRYRKEIKGHLLSFYFVGITIEFNVSKKMVPYCEKEPNL